MLDCFSFHSLLDGSLLTFWKSGGPGITSSIMRSFQEVIQNIVFLIFRQFAKLLVSRFSLVMEFDATADLPEAHVHQLHGRIGG